MSFCFRIRFHMSGVVRINADVPEIPLSDHGASHEVTLQGQAGTNIDESERLSVIGRGYASHDHASADGDKWRGVLEKAFARVCIGVDFGDRAPQSAFTAAGIQMVEQQLGERVLNDTHGLMTFECEPWPKFISVGASASVGRNADDLRSAIALALGRDSSMTGIERLAYDLYSASFAQASTDARFMMLMMSLETLIGCAPRQPQVVEHVEKLITMTRDSGLAVNEVASIIGSLAWLKSESISQAGRRLADTLGDRPYMNMAARKFFTDCYALRSQLAHGGFPRAEPQVVDTHAAALKHFIGDLLSRDLT